MLNQAKCSCGSLCVTVAAEPYAVVICHCRACQMRTGSVLGVGAYFDRAEVEIEGDAKHFERAVEDRKFHSYFCPECGTSLYWESDLHPTGIGIALGCFEDPAAFTPSRSVWEVSKTDWLHLDSSVPGHVEGRRSPLSR